VTFTYDDAGTRKIRARKLIVRRRRCPTSPIGSLRNDSVHRSSATIE